MTKSCYFYKSRPSRTSIKTPAPKSSPWSHEIADDFPHLDGKQRYIGVKGKSSIMLVSSPGGEDNSSYAEEEGLYEFYGPKEGEQ